ncbi:MAG TPA: 2,4-dihydroxyhept-2-ene-1,7-dioic acid aldolase [Desulfotomaculum sp.]|nr:MAG: HpcH/HpaI aldolase [Desulfotomaculum sp. 46_296]HAG10148.1 2,4-dihydroxyhept-2-ene-1,7-dioic acid aldolase [Desulfotomaculum sp.]HBY03661.1 2,4-dihydroxyhept-2-ene-1,7-dioic acid aldolase [Desulfotomaculum sp.]
MINLKEKLRKNELTIGSWITLGHSSIAEIMCQAAFDWLVVDMEHSAITLDQTQEIVRAIELNGIVPLVRVGENNANLIKRVMDAGAHGVIVPMISCLDDAVKAVQAVKYPPYGTRGIGLARAQGYGARFTEYKKWVNEESIVVAQIEHIKGVENLEDILNADFIDAIIVGPYDLSGSLGIPGQFENPIFIDVLTRIKNTTRKLNKVLGYHEVSSDPNLLLQKIKEGYSFLAYSIDIMFLGESCKSGLSIIKDNLK